MLQQNCEVCGILATLKCGGCKSAIYCGKDHQKQHWKKGHKLQCKCYELITDPIFGRCLRATRDISQGEIIIRECPLVIGPKMVSTPTCLGCLRLLETPKNGEDYRKCSKCHWPLCNKACENSNMHQAECDIMTSKKFRCNISFNNLDGVKKESAYCVIVPLRCLLLKLSQPEQFEKLMNLEDHLDDRINTPIYSILKSNLVTFIRRILAFDSYDDKAILKIAAILDTNAFEIRNPRLGSKVRAIFPIAAMMSHDCVPNTKHVFDDQNQILVIAAVTIPKGTIIKTSYSQPLECTLQRRAHLKQTKCFACTCTRCCDPTEFQSYAGSLICSQCKTGKLLSDDPLNRLSKWNCNNCNYEVPGRQIALTNDALRKEIEILPRTSPKFFEEFIIKYDDTLHPTNTHILQIKYALTQLYGNVQGFRLNELNDAGLMRKISLCEELLDISNSFQPGWSHFRGSILLDLQDAIAFQTKRDFNKQLITKQIAQEKLLESMSMLQEAIEIIKFEPGMEAILKDKLKSLVLEMQ